MKHSSLILVACCLFAVFFAGCETIGGTDPLRDTTKLWPAYDNATHMWGYINAKGKMVIPAQYDEANGFSCGYALVRKGNQSHYIDKHGSIQYSFYGYNGYDFYNDYVVRVERVGDWLKYGLMNKDFEYVIQPSFEYMDNVGSNGLVAVDCWREDVNEKRIFAYVNTSGEKVISLDNRWITPFVDGYAIVSGRGGRMVIDTEGMEIIPAKYRYLFYLGGDMFACGDAESWGEKLELLSAQGVALSAPIGGTCYESSVDNGLIPIRNGDRKWGYMDFNRNLFIDYQYHTATPFYEGYAFVEEIRQEEHDGGIVNISDIHIINTEGEVLCTLSIKYGFPLTGFHNGLALLRRGFSFDDEVRYRYINVKGETVYEWIEEDIIRSPRGISKGGNLVMLTSDSCRVAPASTTHDLESMQWFQTAQEFTEQTLHFSSVRLMND